MEPEVYSGPLKWGCHSGLALTPAWVDSQWMEPSCVTAEKERHNICDKRQDFFLV